MKREKDKLVTAFGNVGRFLAKKRCAQGQRLVDALEARGRNNLTARLVASLCGKVNAFTEGRDCLKELDQWFLKFEYIDEILIYLDQEFYPYVLWQKIEMVNLLRRMDYSEQILDLIAAKKVPMFKRGAFFLGLCNILRNEAMTPNDSLPAWNIFLHEYIQDFGFFANRMCILIYRQLIQGHIPSGLGIDSVGPKGVEQFRNILNTRAQGIFDKGDINEKDLDDPLTAMAIARATGFSLSLWGHGALGEMALRSFITRFQDRKKIILGGSLIGALKDKPFMLNFRKFFFVRRAGPDRQEGHDLVEACITKGILGEQAGDIGHTCYSRVEDIMAYPSMVAAILFIRGERGCREFIGSAFILENQIKGKRVWLLCALNFQEKFRGKYDLDDFIEGTIGYVQELARIEGMDSVLSPIGISTAVSMRSKVSRAFRKFVTGKYLFLDFEESFHQHPMQDKVKALTPVPFRSDKAYRKSMKTAACQR